MCGAANFFKENLCPRNHRLSIVSVVIAMGNIGYLVLCVIIHMNQALSGKIFNFRMVLNIESTD